MNERLILTCIAIILIFLSGCDKKPTETVGDLYVEYQANFGKSAAELLLKKDEFQIINDRLKLLDIKKIANLDSTISIETFSDFQYRCSKQKNSSSPEISCYEYQITYEPDVKQVPTGQKLVLLLDRTQDPPTLAVPSNSSTKSFKLTRIGKQPDYKIFDAKIVGLPQTGEELQSTMYFSVD